MISAPVKQPHKRLAEFAARVKELRAQYNASIQTGAVKAKAIGEVLLCARGLCRGRVWSRWLWTECEMTTTTAYRYMALAQGWQKVESHPAFGSMDMHQMYAVARGATKLPDRKDVLVGSSFNRLLDALEKKLWANKSRHPAVELMISTIKAWRETLSECGLLQKQGAQK